MLIRLALLREHRDGSPAGVRRPDPPRDQILVADTCRDFTSGHPITQPRIDQIRATVVMTFRNVGTTPSRLVAMIWPAVAFEGFVTEAGTPEPLAGPPDLEKLLAAATKHGIVVPPPDSTAT
jgi:hypothetical protein